MTEHTELPWTVDQYGGVNGPNGRTISANGFAAVLSPGESQNEARANAAFIVKAVNSHDELVDILGRAREWVELAPELPGLATTDEYEARGLLAEIDAALAKAQQP